MSIYDVPKTELIEESAKKLKELKEITPPEWAGFVKTGCFKERPPVDKDWWYVRTASILAKLAFFAKPIGVSKLRTLYGGKKNMGYRPERFKRASGSIIRKILQQLEKAGLAKKIEKNGHKGRTATEKGIALLDSAAAEIMKKKGITIAPKPKEELKIAEPQKEKKPKAKKPAAPRKKKTKKTETTEPQQPVVAAEVQ